MTLDEDLAECSDEEFEEYMGEMLSLEIDSKIGLLALFYRNLWAMADLREKLKEFEDLEELIGIPMKDLAEILRQNIPEDCKNPKKAIVLTDDDVDKWNGYKNAEEQGLRLPCKVGDKVYCIYERYTKCSENEQEFDEYSCQGCECLECDSHKEFYVQSQKAYSLDWIVSNLKRFGKTVFLTQEEAEQKLKEMSK